MNVDGVIFGIATTVDDATIVVDVAATATGTGTGGCDMIFTARGHKDALTDAATAATAATPYTYDITIIRSRGI